MSRWIAVLALGLLVFAPQSGLSADIAVDPEDAAGLAGILVRGTLNEGDAARFREKAAPLSKALVILDGPGGNLLAGLQIGEMIRMKGFATGVVGTCASACALAWLGGTTRFMTRQSKIGFHAAANDTDGSETGVGNAVVGAYATRLGLPYTTVVYITLEGPDSMVWLTPAKANEVGIDVILHEQTPKQPVASLSTTAQRIITTLHDTQSDAPASALQVLSRVLAPQLVYYGKTV